MPTPLDIINVLTAAAPIVASVASIANTPEPVIHKENPNVTNNISITVNNHFYTGTEREAIDTASRLQNDLIGNVTSDNRYTL